MPLKQSVLGLIAVNDHRLMRRVNRWAAPRWIRLWMICATRGGDGWVWYAVAAAVALFGGDERWRAVAAMGLSVAVGIAVFLSLKRATGRRRPCAIEPHRWATLLPPDQFSFPSGHTITAFAAASSLQVFYPQLAPGLYFCGASIAISRVLLGMHFASDVAAGALIGALLGNTVAGFLV